MSCRLTSTSSPPRRYPIASTRDTTPSLAGTCIRSRAAAPDFAPATLQRDKSTVVLVDRLDIVDEGDLILVAVEGSHFLWKMVRRMVGVLVEVGRGALEPSAAAGFLTAASTAPARLTAPPSGLF